MKKLFLISLLVCVGILQSFAFDYTDERGVTWCCIEADWNEETHSYTSASIYSAIGYGNEVVIPEKVYNGTKEYTVTDIGAAFENNETVEKVTLPSTFTTILSCTFQRCTNLKIVENIRQVTEIKNDAFNGCVSLIALDLGSCKIGCNAFSGCSRLQSIGNPKLTSIPDGAFEGCSSLENIDLSLCTSVGYAAFRGCSKLQNVNIPNCTYIGSSAFSGCTSITEVDLSACKSLGDNAFSGCTKLANAIGLEKFKSIPDGAFCGTALKSVKLPVCTAIGSSAFESCIDLQSVDLPKVESIGCNAFWNSGITKISLPETLKSMGYRCFDNVKEYIFSND